MFNMKQRKWTGYRIIISIMILLVSFVFSVSAKGTGSHEVISGSCGTNISWVIDEQGVLTISGTGAIELDGGTIYRWNEYRVIMEGVVVGVGITAFR